VPSVDFYVLEGSDARERLRFACQVINKAFEAEQRVLVCLDSAAELTAFDDLLWTFAQDSFVPHEPLTPNSDWEETPVLLTTSQSPPSAPDVLVNLAQVLPATANSAARVIEIIDADDTRRQAGRVRFRQYRERGIEPQTHKLGAGAEG
jgi:DNA polymerase III subunit chi